MVSAHLPERPAMALTKETVRESLAKVPAPDGRPLTASGTLSDIVVSDGKVFFSLTVDAAAVPQWEPVRKQAEDAVRALPEIKSVLVALTAERAAGGGARPSQAQAAAAQARATQTSGQPAPGIPGV